MKTCRKCGETKPEIRFQPSTKMADGRCNVCYDCRVPRKPMQDRFWSYVQKSDGGCWEWMSGKDRNGYGLFSVRCRQKRANRVAWELTMGPIADGLYVLHRCDNPGCVNPAHLFLGTNDENMADMVAKQRQAAGERHASRLHPELCKLSADRVARIRQLRKDGLTLRSIGDRFGVSESTVCVICKHQTWSWVQDGVSP